jgi:hypothetical protein
VLPSILRTVVPLIVGWVLAQPVVAGLGVTEADATTAATAVVTGLYYVAVRLLEQLHPRFGWLLGLPVAPTYTATDSDS